MSDDSRPEHKSTLHGHIVYCDDEDIRHYLKHLSGDEADVIFEHAKVHGSADFDMNHHGTHHRCHVEHGNGFYVVTSAGTETGWV